MTQQNPRRSHIDDIIGLIDKVFGDDDGGPVPDELISPATGRVVIHRPSRVPRPTFPMPPFPTRTGPRGARKPYGVRELAGLTFDDLVAYLGRKTECQLAHNTTISRRGPLNDPRVPPSYHVTLHRTVILSFGRDVDGAWMIILNSGGYRTTTTKQRLNALLAKTNYRVYAKNRVWFVSTPDGDVEFEDGMVLGA